VPPEATFEVWIAGFDPEREGGVTQESNAPKDACHRSAVGRTTQAGTFDIDGLCPGSYSIRFTSIPGLAQIDGFFPVPADNVRIVLPGYLVRVNSVDAARRPVPLATIAAKFTRDPDPSVPAPAPLFCQISTDRDAEGLLYFPDPGTLTIAARQGIQYSDQDTISLLGTSRTIAHALVLDKAYAGAILRVSIRDCDEPAAIVSDYCLTLHGLEHDSTELRVCSEAADVDGAIRHLRPGHYLAESAMRYFGPPAFYLKQQPAERTPIELSDGQETSVELCVHLGGRISLRLTEADATETTPTIVSVQVDLESAAGTLVTHLDFRQPDASGVTVERSVPLGTERMTENVIAPGDYFVAARAEGYSVARYAVSIHRGELTRLTGVLKRARN
jgi:hypothetical protein